MHIIMVCSDNSQSTSDLAGILKDYCEDKTLHVFYSPADAKTFLMNQVLIQKGHIDCIITDWNFGNSLASELREWVRNSSNSYSDDNFQFRSLPMLIIEDKNDQNRSRREGFDAVITDFPDRFRLSQSIKQSIRKWRSQVADDLDIIGLDPKTQHCNWKHRQSFTSYYRLQVLTKTFVDNHSKKLNYIWTDPDMGKIQVANEEFEERIKNVGKKQPYLEKNFHEFFHSVPTFVKGEDYRTTKSELLYEKHLYKAKGDRSYNEVDFLNRPREYSLLPPEIFEIKRHTQKIYNPRTNDMLSRARKSFEQVVRYKKYFNSADPYHQYHIKRYLGKLYDSYNYTLLMGTKDEKLENEDFLQKLCDDPDFADIKLVTYTELLDRHVRMCNRLVEFNIL